MSWASTPISLPKADTRERAASRSCQMWNRGRGRPVRAEAEEVGRAGASARAEAAAEWPVAACGREQGRPGRKCESHPSQAPP
eukprot:4482757-Prymnesium_polylepis.2